MNCGALNSSDAPWCTQCHRPVGEVAAGPAPPPPPDPFAEDASGAAAPEGHVHMGSKWWWIVPGGVVAVGLLILWANDWDGGSLWGSGRRRSFLPYWVACVGFLALGGTASLYKRRTGKTIGGWLGGVAVLGGVAAASAFLYALPDPVGPHPGPLEFTSVRRAITLDRDLRAALVLRQYDLDPDCGGTVVDDVRLVAPNGSLVVTDTFDNQPLGLGVTSLTGWGVDGNVDVIGAGSVHDLFPGHGRYIDLDGTGSCGNGAISSQRLELSPGTYTLMFELGSNPFIGGDDNSVHVDLGEGYSETFRP